MPTLLDAAVTDIDLEEVIRAVERLEQTSDTRLRMALGQIAGEVATHAKLHHDYKDRTGKLTASIRADTVQGSFGTGLHVDMLAGGRGGPGTVFYAAHIEFGTKAHVIRAKRKRTLNFVQGGKERFPRMVQHPGTRAYKFMANAMEAKLPRAEQLLNVAMELAIDEAGLA